jgi:hypothetical protein
MQKDTFDVVGNFNTPESVDHIVEDSRISIKCLRKTSVPGTTTVFTSSNPDEKSNQKSGKIHFSSRIEKGMRMC